MSAGGFRPAWWLPSPHLMTIFPVVARRRPKVQARRERLELPDGDFVDLAWVGQARSPLVVVLHGLEGSLDSPYVRGILSAIEARGWRGLLMHFRGCSGEPNRLARAYHSGETEDLRTLLRLIRARGEEPAAAVGYSLGGNVLLKYLGEEGSSAGLSAAVAVSVPMMLAPCADRLQRGFSKLYDRWLLSSLKKSMRRKARQVPLGVELSTGIDSIRSFDEQVTAPLHGFSGADDYYARASSRPYLPKIRTPTLILQARDDPFLTEEVLPGPAELPAGVTLEISEHGGHVGFVGGNNPFAPDYWLERRIPEFLDPHLG
ncbi:MAG: hydrolase [Myxococcota bacterium]